jgi:hypothetical protein
MKSIDRESVSELMDSDRATEFLVRLAGNLCLSARARYEDAGADALASSVWLHGHNEMLLQVMQEIRYELGFSSRARDGGAFLDSLDHWAELDGCKDGLEWSVRRSVEVLGRPDGTPRLS